MENNYRSQANDEIVRVLHQMEREGRACVSLLQWLRSHTTSQEEFTQLFIAALEYRYDDGSLWVIASRWWSQNISDIAANRYFDLARKNP